MSVSGGKAVPTRPEEMPIPPCLKVEANLSDGEWWPRGSEDLLKSLALAGDPFEIPMEQLKIMEENNPAVVHEA